jgi:hypothetical protein
MIKISVRIQFTEISGTSITLVFRIRRCHISKELQIKLVFYFSTIFYLHLLQNAIRRLFQNNIRFKIYFYYFYYQITKLS